MKTQVQQQGRPFPGLQGGWEGRPGGEASRDLLERDQEADASGRELGASDSLPEGELVQGVRTPAEVRGPAANPCASPCPQSA